MDAGFRAEIRSDHERTPNLWSVWVRPTFDARASITHYRTPSAAYAALMEVLRGAK